MAFYRLFLYVPEESCFAFRIRLCPDREQLGTVAAPTAVISLSSDEALSLCLAELGVTGYSRFRDDTLAGPRFDYIQNTPEDIVAAIRAKPFSSVSHVTLIAKDTPPSEMRRRLDSLREKIPDTVEIVEPAETSSVRLL